VHGSILTIDHACSRWLLESSLERRNLALSQTRKVRSTRSYYSYLINLGCYKIYSAYSTMARHSVIAQCHTYRSPNCVYTVVDPGQIRCRMGFTVRDGADDYINVTVWGSQSYLDKLSSSFKIYDVGKLGIGLEYTRMFC
jgi:hypothetical protein